MMFRSFVLSFVIHILTNIKINESNITNESFCVTFYI